jgi:transcriptional regulator with XRE-family HTH domain
MDEISLTAMESALKHPDESTRLRLWRSNAGWSLQEVADVVGCSTSMLSRLERGQRNASPKLRVVMARRLGVAVGDLFDVEPLDDDDGG